MILILMANLVLQYWKKKLIKKKNNKKAKHFDNGNNDTKGVKSLRILI